MTSQTPTSKTLTPQQAFVLADRHLRVGKSAAAETLYRQILKQLPNHPHAFYRLGIIADTAWRQAISLKPDNAKLYKWLGKHCSVAKDLRKQKRLSAKLSN
ncbi:MAG: hypothetical protein GDA43_13890 [Hormoscilla sp. SP5CHS1]|nr:hypothetical protein [Hormoscilla sp. SP12CHS1]MBC6454150.1 hypothetical protein [Hormoscilla sp. SP5CHS1]MBC6472535.1 hypothetical protein [Hormoscilla sp. GM102CHS1]